MALFRKPGQEYAMIFCAAVALGISFFLPSTLLFSRVLGIVAIILSLPTLWRTLVALVARSITIDTFNVVALAASIGTGEIRSALFIILMLSSASILDFYTESRSQAAIEALLALKPLKASRENDKGEIEEIDVDAVRTGDELVVTGGSRIPVDGVVIFGRSEVNESSVSGESQLVHKTIGDAVTSATLNESSVLKIRATRVGKDSTIERMVALVREAAKHKSRSEKLADRFAAIFLPIVLAAAAVTYGVTHNVQMTVALFLVACADDMAVAIPLAMAASIGRAAKRGVVVKGGAWLDILGKVKTVVIDKTGTLTYGTLALRDVTLAPGVDENEFWRSVGIAEKFSEHPVGRLMFREALHRTHTIPDPEDFTLHAGEGVHARSQGHDIVIGNEELCAVYQVSLSDFASRAVTLFRDTYQGTSFFIAIDGNIIGVVAVADAPRSDAQSSIASLQHMGIGVIMFTGDTQEVAEAVSKKLNITNVHASLKPEDKLRELEKLLSADPVCMVGDGINDAPALARADVSVAMGSGGTAVAVETADIVVLSDNLSRLPEMVLLGRDTTKVIHTDMLIWLASNVVGFTLVLTGVAGPVLAAFYNFATDFFPLINSMRLFRDKLTLQS